MNYQFTCPYCFEQIDDDKVHFRSKKINRRDSEPEDILPIEYNDIDDFISRYNGPDKDERIEKYEEWVFFTEKDDEKYERFWSRHGDVKTEFNSLDEANGIISYRRPVLDPHNPKHQKYLKLQGEEDVFFYDADHMVRGIELSDGTRCTDRVCPHCHNPLPPQYGKNSVKYISVIGVSRSGKTVYISQLIRGLSKFAAEVGLAVHITSQSTNNFLNNHTVKEGVRLPTPTPETHFQQPLFYDLSQTVEGEKKRTETIVIYDIAGEVFRKGTADRIYQYAEFVEHADGIIMLIDPKQMGLVEKQQIDEEGSEDELEAKTTLNAIHEITSANVKSSELCKTPIAVCIPKIDDKSVFQKFPEELQGLLQETMTGVKARNGFDFDTVFNAKQYNPIGISLHWFMEERAQEVATFLKDHYKNYNYFAFSAIGDNTLVENTPQDPVLPIRIQEPLFWLLLKFGIIGKNAVIYNPKQPEYIQEKCCPKCGWDLVEMKSKGFIHKKYFRHCNVCGHEWE